MTDTSLNNSYSCSRWICTESSQRRETLVSKTWDTTTESRCRPLDRYILWYVHDILNAKWKCYLEWKWKCPHFK